MIETLRKMIAGLSERERRMALIGALAFFCFIVFLLVFLVQSGISKLGDEREEYAKALQLLDQKEQDYLDIQREFQRQQNKGRSKPTPLRTLVDKISKGLSITVPDVKELPDQRHQGSWLERAVELSLREVGLRSLTRFMEEVEGNKTRFPIAITKLEIRKRRRTQDAYDVKMIISTYERVQDEMVPGKRLPNKMRKGGR